MEQVCAEQGVPCVLSEVFAKGGEGGKALAEKVLEVMEDRPIQYTYPLDMPLKDKINAIATKIYRADGVNYSAAASKTLAELTEMGYGDLPVCIAKTQYSFSDNAKLTGAPTGFTMEVREVRLAAGAGFVVVICGNIMTMPGLPKKPAAVGIDVDADGKITACSDPIKNARRCRTVVRHRLFSFHCSGTAMAGQMSPMIHKEFGKSPSFCTAVPGPHHPAVWLHR